MTYTENLKLLQKTKIPADEQETLILFDYSAKMVHIETTNYYEAKTWEKLANTDGVEHIPSFHSVRLKVPANMIRKPRFVIKPKHRL